jgi:hypothetical protein
MVFIPRPCRRPFPVYHPHPTFLFLLFLFIPSHLTRVHGCALGPGTLLRIHLFSLSCLSVHCSSTRQCVSLSTLFSSSLRLRIPRGSPTPKRTIHWDGIYSTAPSTVFTREPFVTAPVWRETFASRSEALAGQTLRVDPWWPGATTSHSAYLTPRVSPTRRTRPRTQTTHPVIPHRLQQRAPERVLQRPLVPPGPIRLPISTLYSPTCVSKPDLPPFFPPAP